MCSDCYPVASLLGLIDTENQALVPGAASNYFNAEVKGLIFKNGTSTIVNIIELMLSGPTFSSG